MSSIIHFTVLVSILVLCAADSTICNNQAELSEQQIWDLFSFNQFSLYFILIIGSLSIIGLLASLLSWIWVRSFALPFDIIFIILISSAVQNLSFVIQAAYYKTEQGNPTFNNFSSMCGGVGFINLLAFVTCLYYNSFFCGALAYSIQNTIRKPLLSQIKLHIICVTIIVCALLIIIFTNHLNNQFSQICIYRIANSSSLGLFFLHLIILVFSFYSLRKFKTKIPENSFFQKHSHFKFYFIYMVIFCISQLINTLTFLISNLSCSTQAPNVNVILQVLYNINVIVILLQSFASMILRLGHPLILKKIRRIFRSQGLQMIQQNSQQLILVSSLVDSIKGSQVLSFIEAIMINFISQMKKYPMSLTPYHFQRQYSFSINQNVTEDYIKRRITNRQSHFTKRSVDGLTTLKYEVIIYTPQFYSWVIRKEKINLFSSFDIRKNLSLVKQESFTEGGKSGEFFFGTYDHKFIFKTIQAQEASVLVAKTQELYTYFSKNQETLLIKIIGLYKFERKDVKQDDIYLIIMKNLTMTHKSVNLRVYDIKGSEYNRSTFKDKRIKANDEQKLKKYTLKDKDFLILEERVHIDSIQARQLKARLATDINFLASLGVMDYSLLIIKRQGHPTNQKGQFRSTLENNVIYNVGIIDYLQEWTLKRKAERAFKTLITNEEVTANSPQAYAQRLIVFINRIM